MTPEFHERHAQNIQAMVNRLSIEQDIPLDVARAMLAQSNIIIRLAGEMKRNNIPEKELHTHIMAFLGSWALLDKKLNLPEKRLIESAKLAIELTTETKKKFIEEAKKELELFKP